MQNSNYGLTLERAYEKLNLWLEAEDAIASGQSYSIGSRSLTRASLAEVREQILFWQGQINILKAGGKRKTVRPRIWDY